MEFHNARYGADSQWLWCVTALKWVVAKDASGTGEDNHPICRDDDAGGSHKAM